ncbi:KAP family P-loop NTPase fold protein [Brevundimonas vesicularis]|uniref:KAP family NTPase n=1 Tax=Brevundimonas vesicularis TaxID=41276 RepID=A0ABU4KLV0_BREVE|nr:P-loop NTPase fold protein [Brevundimonas vesicularis]MDX2333727.1 KAP family NTPase [Brevundimonas vesicularis]
MPINPYAEIWAGDLFSRQKDATMLAAYIESIAGRPNLREDHKGFTISVDAEYGTGKSYFLKRLSRHLSVKHPVAFVDAWADDLADDPLTAIAATLSKALGPLTAKDQMVANSMEIVTGKVGTIAKIVGKGIVKKAVALALTESVSNELFDVVSPDDAEKFEDTLKDAGNIIGDGLVDGITQKSSTKLMTEKIANFKAGQGAVVELKISLEDLVRSIDKTNLTAPIVVIIDELDRCRPPYAIKLLEELKHLFDVSGIVFVLGLNSSQLSKAIKAAYGPEFDGVSYLRRFIDRQYTLGMPDLKPLVAHVTRELSLDSSRLECLQTKERGKVERHDDPSRMIARYMEMYGVNARSTFSVGDILQTCLAVTAPNELFMPVLMPHVIAKSLHLNPRQLTVGPVPNWNYILYSEDYDNKYDEMSPESYFTQATKIVGSSQNEMMHLINSGNRVARSLSNYIFNKSAHDLSHPANYANLMEAVARFS